MKSTVLFVLLVAGVLQTFADQEKYLTWIKFDGEIPDNAISVGVDADNKPIYLGRGYYTTTNAVHFNWDDAAGWVPVGLSSGAKFVNITLFHKLHQSNQLEILTTKADTKLEWRDTNSYDFPRLFDTEDYHPVRGGWECTGQECFNATLYVAKVQYNNHDALGKVKTYSDLATDVNIAFSAGDSEEISNDAYSTLIYYY